MKKRLTIISALFFTFLFLNFYTLPYYVMKPGMAESLDGIIEVEGGYDEQGELMLTTVRMGEANIISYLMTKINKYYVLEPKEVIRMKNETDEEYQVRQLYYMEDSQENALQVAFKKAGKDINIKMNGIYVLSVRDDMPSSNVLRPGDRIIAIDEHTFDSSLEFTNYIQSKKVGDEIHVTFLRNNKKMTKKIAVDMIPEINKPGIGITLVEDKDVKTKPKVHFNSEKIGGPSAGLMFTLEIYNQLTEEDITKGYKIAGTGTISPDGTVGPIGGIEQKIVAADREGVELFFAPNEQGKKGSNYKMAKKTAKELKSNMKIIPIDSFDDALKYLSSLEKE